MNILRLALGILAGLWCLSIIYEFITKLDQIDSSTPGLTHLVAGIGAIALTGALTIWLLKGATRK